MPLDNSYLHAAKDFTIFDYNKNAYGGTEYMASNFHKKILADMPKLKNYDCFVLPGEMPPPYKLETSTKPVIIWMHNTVYQFNANLVDVLVKTKVLNRLKYLIVISEFQKQETLKHTDIDESKIIVIPNAIEPLKYDPKKFDSPKLVKLIHTSTTERGLPILLNALTKIDEDFRLEVYNDFYPHLYPEYTPDPRIKFYGKTPKDTVIEAIESSHIHAYPSIYPETFCLSQAEAMSAGLLCVTSDIGALPEISNGLTRIYPYEENQEKHFNIYVEHLTKAINDIKNNNWNPEKQIKYVNETYSWENIKQQWLDLHELL